MLLQAARGPRSEGRVPDRVHDQVQALHLGHELHHVRVREAEVHAGEERGRDDPQEPQRVRGEASRVCAEPSHAGQVSLLELQTIYRLSQSRSRPSY